MCLAISAVLSLLYHHCYSLQKTKSRLLTPISIVVHAEVVCAPKILPIGIFLSHTLRSKIIALWGMTRYQISRRISLETSVFYLHFQVRYFLAVLWTSRLDAAAEETWVRGQFSFYREWYGRLMTTTTLLTPSPQRHLALIYCPDQPIRQRGETKTDEQQTRFGYSVGFSVENMVVNQDSRVPLFPGLPWLTKRIILSPKFLINLRLITSTK